MSKIYRIEEIPENEKVYLKKDFMGWRTVEPWKDPETNQINWFNFLTGGKRNLFILAVIALIALSGYLAFKEQITNYKIVVQTPCLFCPDSQFYDRYLNNPVNSKINELLANYSFKEGSNG